MKETLLQYYQGVLADMRSNVDHVNALFQHQGLKGTANENELIGLLRKFLPKKFGIGSGVVIDKNGNQSRQCDIVIYDEQNYPTLLSHSTISMYPVDIVLATIEVKTTLSPQSARDSLDNLKSVRDLEVVNGDFFDWEPKKRGGGSVMSYSPESPLGYIFSYNCTAASAKTFKNWFDLTKVGDLALMAVSLDLGLVQSISRTSQFQALCFPVHKSGAVAFPKKPEERMLFEGLVYPVKLLNGKHVLIDQSRVLLTFFLHLSTQLNQKKINPNIDFSEEYFSKEEMFGIIVD